MDIGFHFSCINQQEKEKEKGEALAPWQKPIKSFHGWPLWLCYLMQQIGKRSPTCFMEDGLHLPDSSRKFNFGILPTGIPIPPSRRHSRKTSSSPSPPFHLSRSSNFGMQHSGPSLLLRDLYVIICRNNNKY